MSPGEATREFYRRQGANKEQQRIIAIIEKLREYDCRCQCKCHAEPSPCIPCQANAELIDLIKGA